MMVRIATARSPLPLMITPFASAQQRPGGAPTASPASRIFRSLRAPSALPPAKIPDQAILRGISAVQCGSV